MEGNANERAPDHNGCFSRSVISAVIKVVHGHARSAEFAFHLRIHSYVVGECENIVN